MKDRRAVAKDLKPIYQAATEDAAASELEAFDEIWAGKYPMIGESWRARWELFTPFLAFPEPIRRIVYTTNSIEAVNRQLRKIIKTRGHFPTEDAAMKLLWLSLRNAEKKWTYPIKTGRQPSTNSPSTSPAKYPSTSNPTSSRKETHHKPSHLHRTPDTPLGQVAPIAPIRLSHPNVPPTTRRVKGQRSP